MIHSLDSNRTTHEIKIAGDYNGASAADWTGKLYFSDEYFGYDASRSMMVARGDKHTATDKFWNSNRYQMCRMWTGAGKTIVQCVDTLITNNVCGTGKMTWIWGSRDASIDNIKGYFRGTDPANPSALVVPHTVDDVRELRLVTLLGLAPALALQICQHTYVLKDDTPPRDATDAWILIGSPQVLCKASNKWTTWLRANDIQLSDIIVDEGDFGAMKGRSNQWAQLLDKPVCSAAIITYFSATQENSDSQKLPDPYVHITYTRCLLERSIKEMRKLTITCDALGDDDDNLKIIVHSREHLVPCLVQAIRAFVDQRRSDDMRGQMLVFVPYNARSAGPVGAPGDGLHTLADYVDVFTETARDHFAADALVVGASASIMPAGLPCSLADFTDCKVDILLTVDKTSRSFDHPLVTTVLALSVGHYSSHIQKLGRGQRVLSRGDPRWRNHPNVQHYVKTRDGPQVMQVIELGPTPKGRGVWETFASTEGSAARNMVEKTCAVAGETIPAAAGDASSMPWCLRNLSAFTADVSSLDDDTARVTLRWLSARAPPHQPRNVMGHVRLDRMGKRRGSTPVTPPVVAAVQRVGGDEFCATWQCTWEAAPLARGALYSATLVLCSHGDAPLGQVRVPHESPAAHAERVDAMTRTLGRALRGIRQQRLQKADGGRAAVYTCHIKITAEALPLQPSRGERVVWGVQEITPDGSEHVVAESRLHRTGTAPAATKVLVRVTERDRGDMLYKSDFDQLKHRTLQVTATVTVCDPERDTLTPIVVRDQFKYALLEYTPGLRPMDEASDSDSDDDDAGSEWGSGRDSGSSPRGTQSPVRRAKHTRDADEDDSERARQRVRGTDVHDCFVSERTRFGAKDNGEMEIDTEKLDRPAHIPRRQATHVPTAVDNRAADRTIGADAPDERIREEVAAVLHQYEKNGQIAFLDLVAKVQARMPQCTDAYNKLEELFVATKDTATYDFNAHTKKCKVDEVYGVRGGPLGSWYYEKTKIVFDGCDYVFDKDTDFILEYASRL